MQVKTRKAEQAESTRAQLVSTARRLFAERGYAGTATEELVREARVTRGALYHHFRDKRDLFHAVYEDVEGDVVQAANSAAAASGGDAWQRVRAGCQGFLDACLEPDVQRIALLDAPSVLGWETWRRIDRKGVDLLRQGIATAMDAGLIASQPVGPLAHLLLGALAEAAVLLSRSDDLARDRRDVVAAFDRIMDGLRA